MRLLKTFVEALEFQDFYDHNVPRYAILSHTWSENPNDEVLYKDAVLGTAQTKPGYRKIRATIRQANADGYEYCWVDTCCIDKTSSADLSEAINSMFRYYCDAGICYAYLEDFPSKAQIFNNADLIQALSSCRWFTRGWTLQELLAPSEVVFFSGKWISSEPSVRMHAQLGGKQKLADGISRITGIESGILKGTKDIESASVAQRMSWAANRRTSRLEDEAYCLMGLFGVNMPMLHGEGRRAFLRLQEEIIKHSSDASIFAWQSGFMSDHVEHGLFASSPSVFAESGRFVPSGVRSPPWSMNNKGLDVHVHFDKHGEGLAALACIHLDKVGLVAVRLKRISNDQYMRVLCHRLFMAIDIDRDPIRISVPQTRPRLHGPTGEGSFAFNLRSAKFEQTSQTNDYTVKEAIFANDHLPYIAGELKWVRPSVLQPLVKSDPRGKLAEDLAIFLLRSDKLPVDIILTLTVQSTSAQEPGHDPEHGHSLLCGVTEMESHHSLTDFEAYKGCFDRQSVRLGWTRIKGDHIKAIKLDYELKVLPGGLCFIVDLIIQPKTKVFRDGKRLETKKLQDHAESETGAKQSALKKLAFRPTF